MARPLLFKGGVMGTWNDKEVTMKPHEISVDEVWIRRLRNHVVQRIVFDACLALLPLLLIALAGH
jgi:hypothetical protein